MLHQLLKWFANQSGLANAAGIIGFAFVVLGFALGFARWFFRQRLRTKDWEIENLKKDRERRDQTIAKLQSEVDTTKQQRDTYEVRLPETILAQVEKELSDGSLGLANDVVMGWIHREGEIMSRLLLLGAEWRDRYASGESRAQGLLAAEAYATAALVFWPQNEVASDLREDVQRHANEDEPPSLPLTKILFDDPAQHALEPFNADEVAAANAEEGEARRLRKLGRYHLALLAAELAVRLNSKNLGGNHCQTLKTRLLRAKVLQRLGRHGEALEEALIVTEVQETKSRLGPSHPDTLASRSLVATIRADLGHYDEALEEALAVVKAMEKSEDLGPSHPDTLASRSLVATIRKTLGQYDEALKEALAAVKAMEKSEDLGPSHPNTLTERICVAGIRADLGQYDEALEEALRVVKAMEESEAATGNN